MQDQLPLLDSIPPHDPQHVHSSQHQLTWVRLLRESYERMDGLMNPA